MLDASRPGLYAFPVFMLLIAFEAWRRRRTGRDYPWRDAAASLGVAVGHKLAGLANAAALAGLFALVWEHRLFTVPLRNWWGPVGLFLAVELAYYGFHRSSHRVRWLWATHGVHHSPTDLNFSAAYRLGWTSLISGAWLFWLPLVALGFHPAAVFGMLGLNLLYQFWLHTELIGRLPRWFEWAFNTPSHHRVHHATNEAYLDRNYGGVLIVFDRLFGSFVGERSDEPCRYGVPGRSASRNPVVIAFAEWAALARDLARAPTWRGRAVAAFGPPP